MSRRECLRFARGWYAGRRVRSFVRPTPLGTLCVITVREKDSERIVGQGAGWPAAYMNLRANLPQKGE